LAEKLTYQKISEMKENPMGQMALEQGMVGLLEAGIPMEEAEDQIIETTKQGIMDELAKFGKDRFPEIDRKMFSTDFDVLVSIGDEQINKAVMAQTLNQTIGILGKVGLPIIDPLRELFDTLGMDGAKVTEAIAEAQEMQKIQQEAQMAPPAPIGAEANMTPTENAGAVNA